MGKNTPQAPTPPDPYKTASAQTGSNIGTAIANAAIGNANTVGPTGSTKFDVTGNTTWTDPTSGQVYQIPQYTSTTTLSPEQQQLYNQQTQLGSSLNTLAQNQVGKLTDVLGSPLDTSSLPALPNSQTGAQDRTAVENALFQRISPQLDLQKQQLDTQLTNQGFQRGSQAYNTAMDQFNRQQNDALLAVTQQGLQEQEGQFGMASQASQQALQQALALRNQPINEISALMSGGQVSLPNAPQYNAPSVANTDLTGDVYNSAALANQQYGQQLQANAAQMGGMFGLGQAGIVGAMKYAPQIASAAAMFPSDRRLKRDIVDLGIRLVNGIKLYAYRYVWEGRRRVGVMADEIARVNPAAVGNVGGFLAVNYRAL